MLLFSIKDATVTTKNKSQKHNDSSLKLLSTPLSPIAEVVNQERSAVSVIKLFTPSRILSSIQLAFEKYQTLSSGDVCTGEKYFILANVQV